MLCLSESLTTLRAALISLEGSALFLFSSMGVNKLAPGNGNPPLLENIDVIPDVVVGGVVGVLASLMTA